MLRLPIARLANVAFHYPGSETTLFANVDLTLDSKSRVCLLGENGEGKTTLVRLFPARFPPF